MNPGMSDFQYLGSVSVWVVRTWSTDDGKQRPTSEYFYRHDAKQAADAHCADLLRSHDDVTVTEEKTFACVVDDMRVIGSVIRGHYVPEAKRRAIALAKLTIEERALLGLKDR